MANSEVWYGDDTQGRMEPVAEWKRGGVALGTPVVTGYASGAVGNVGTVTVTDGASTPRRTTNTYDPRRRWLIGVENERALKHGDRLRSAYRVGGYRVSVLTGPGRFATTVMTPGES